ncbi:MAG TPA: hypothetical protein VFN91_09305, partial [Myxococcaceae bacterium]|nr:hypothetical protein [Myxococcaceae bacterium]
MKCALAILLGLCAGLLPLSSARGEDHITLARPTSEERTEAIRRSRVFEPTDVASKDLYNGPAGEPHL